MTTQITISENKICGFQGEYLFLSNFFPVRIEHENIIYPSVENAYQASKTLDKQSRFRFVHMTAASAKRNGKTLPLRPDWEEIKVPLMKTLLVKKFQQTTLRRKLLSTKNSLIEETNYWNDTFWGVCRNKGENKLGILLMEVRSEIQNEVKNVA
jgi:ribA/ribD-fused uncharacterized protein